MNVRRYLLTIGLALTLVSVFDGCGFAADGPGDVIAARLRLQGYRCEKALSTERDAERSKPDSAVWIVKCAEGVYRVQLVPNMAARVEQIDESK